MAANALGYRAEGLDWSSPTVDRLRSRFGGITWHVGDVRELQFEDDASTRSIPLASVNTFVEGPEQ